MASYLDGWFSLGARFNKATGGTQENKQGIVSDELEELSLEMEDDKLIDIKTKWEKAWEASEVKKQIHEKGGECERYWLGKQYSDVEYKDGRRPLVDNIIFETLETFLPIATRKNPEPVVTSDDTPEGIAIANKVKKMLVYLADILRLRLALKEMTRNWSLRFVGFIKVGWDYRQNDIAVSVPRTQKLILDPKAIISRGEYLGEYIGEIKEDRADTLSTRFPDKSEQIKLLVNSKMATILGYTEWWTDDYVFWTMGKIVLGKAKNPHWNYPQTTSTIDNYGQTTTEELPGQNHFLNSKKPYIPLSIFNLGTMPADSNGLVYQNLTTQDVINKRLRQVDRNADNTNGGTVVSGDHFTREEAQQVGEAMRRGATLYVPRGDVNKAFVRSVGPALPGFIYESLQDYRSRLLDVFGVRGSLPQGTASEETVRGKIIARQQDDSRIGGGITEYIEQASDYVFNWFVQLMYVYYDEPHFASVIGAEQAREYFSLRSSELNKKLMVSVKEGSLIPKDDLTLANQAVDLFAAKAIDPITLLDKLQYPDPRGTAEKALMWQVNPMALFQQTPTYPQGQPGLPLTGGDMMGGDIPVPNEQPITPSAEQESSRLLNSVPIQ